jgi:hypothetical protein
MAAKNGNFRLNIFYFLSFDFHKTFDYISILFLNQLKNSVFTKQQHLFTEA